MPPPQLSDTHIPEEKYDENPNISPETEENADNITLSLTALSTESERAKITTLVFFDLETTGLAKNVGQKNVQITEISMVAVSRDEFCKCTYPDLRDIRVMHKLTLCIKPNCPVFPEASSITGLSDNNLQDLQPFDENTATAIRAFLSHLPKPVCLLAHNGNLFDFPILKAEFEKLNLHLPPDFYIVDTLIAFRKFGMPELPFHQKLHKSVKFKKDGNVSYALQNLHLYFFAKPYIGSHSSEGDCIALAKVCHKVRDKILPWIDQNYANFDSITQLW